MKKFIALAIIAGLYFMTGKPTLDTIVEKIAAAIKEFEGWYEGSRSFRNNNPGNLKFAGQPGVVGIDAEGHAIFDSYLSGWEALKRQIRAMFTGASSVYNLDFTLNDVFRHYAEGNAASYASFVAAKLGVSPDTRLGDLIS